MTEFLNELSENQINYLKQQKKHKYIAVSYTHLTLPTKFRV